MQATKAYTSSRGVRESVFPFIFTELRYVKSIKQKFRVQELRVHTQEKQRKETGSCNS